MTGGTVAALAAAVIGVVGLLVLLAGLGRAAGRTSELERQADWCEDGPVEHLRGECRHADPARAAAVEVEAEAGEVLAEGTHRALADVDLALAVTGDLLQVWPGDPFVLQWRDQLLDERSALTTTPWPPQTPPPAPGARVVRQATRT